jgi:hypothetical protein
MGFDVVATHPAGGVVGSAALAGAIVGLIGAWCLFWLRGLMSPLHTIPLTQRDADTVPLWPILGVLGGVAGAVAAGLIGAASRGSMIGSVAGGIIPGFLALRFILRSQD